MDAVKPREPLFSILNDNDSPSFAVRPRHRQSSSALHYPQQDPSPLLLLHQFDHHYHRDLNTPIPSTPPLSRLNSTSSKASSSTMDSPSPQTPVYNYDPQLVAPYDSILRQDSSAYLPSPSSTITPLIDNMMIVAPSQDHILSYQPKSSHPSMPSNYQGPPIPPVADGPQFPPPPASKSTTQVQQAHSAPANPSTPKKNKYPCLYASSHHCSATFTTSGHAARHGKKHTGEKGVHCPVCNKAFTRKDNMKQHERTHKGSASGSNSDDTNSKRSKAALTKDAARTKKATTNMNQSAGAAGLIHSPLSEVASIDPSVIGTSTLANDHAHYTHASMAGKSEPSRNVSNYPPLGDEPAFGPLSHLDRNADNCLTHSQQPMPRTYSDLDTLAMAAAYDPYSQADTGR